LEFNLSGGSISSLNNYIVRNLLVTTKGASFTFAREDEYQVSKFEVF